MITLPNKVPPSTIPVICDRFSTNHSFTRILSVAVVPNAICIPENIHAINTIAIFFANATTKKPVAVITVAKIKHFRTPVFSIILPRSILPTTAKTVVIVTAYIKVPTEASTLSAISVRKIEKNLTRV